VGYILILPLSTTNFLVLVIFNNNDIINLCATVQ
jgi:hypothetical protein